MLLTSLLAVAALCGAQTPAGTSSGTSQATAEGVEILRRLLVESLDKAFEVETKADRLTLRERHAPGAGMGLVTTLWAGQETVDHARAFHMPAVGLFFTLDVSLPVVVAEEKPQPGAGAGTGASGDEWERIRRELRGNAESGGLFVQRMRVGQPGGAAAIDPKAIEKTIDLALRTVARHAGRIEGLGAGDTATFTLRLSGKSRTLLEDFAPEEFDVYTDAQESAPAGEKNPPGMFSAYVLATSHDVREQHLVIRVPLADLGTLADSPERLRQRAEINLY